MARIAWQLVDYSTGTPTVFNFPVNPREFNPPSRKAGVQWMRPVAPNAQPIIFQGLHDVPEGSMSGAVLDAGFYADLDEWAKKWYPLELHDDLGNIWEILIVELSWTRLKRAINPHRYDYTIRFVDIG